MSSQLAVEINIQKLKFNLFTLSVEAQGLFMSDSRKAPLLSVERLETSLENLNFSTLSFGSTKLIGPDFNIIYYKGDTLNNFEQFLHKLRPETPDTNAKFAMTIHSLIIEDGAFVFDNRKYGYVPNHQVDFDHIKLSDFSFKATDIAIVEDSISANIKRISLKEQSGFELLDFASHFSICSHELSALKTNIATGNTQLNLDFTFKYKSWKDYAQFNQLVRWDAHISASQVNIKDIGYFAANIQGMDNLVRLSAVTEGCVDDFRVDNLLLHIGTTTLLRSDLSIKNVVDIEKAIFDLDINAFQSSAQDISDFRLPKGKQIVLPAFITPLSTSSLSGEFHGSLHNFSTQLMAYTNFGDLSIDVALVDTALESIYCKGKIKTQEFQLGEILQIKDWLGKVDADLTIDASGKYYNSLNYLLNGTIQQMDFKQTQLQNIAVNCEARTNYFFGKLAVNDEKLQFQFDGLLDFERAIPLLHYDLNIETLNLTALDIIKDSVPFTLSTHIYADHIGAKLDSMFGDVYIKNTRMQKENVVFNMEQMTISTIQLDSVQKQTQIVSDCFDMELTGSYVFAKLPYIFQNTVACYIPSWNQKQKQKNSEAEHKTSVFPQKFTMNAQFKNTDDLFALFLPSFRMSPDAQLKFSYQSGVRENLWSVFNSTYLQYGDIVYLNNLTKLETQNNKLVFSTFAQNFNFGDSVGLPKFYVGAEFSGSDTVNWNLSWNNGKLEQDRVFADIRGLLDFSDAEGLFVKLKTSDLFFAKEKWHIGEDASVYVKGRNIDFHNFGIEAMVSNVGVFLNGSISERPNSLLKVSFNKFDLTYLDFIFKRIGMDIEAQVDGQAMIANVYDEFTFSSNLTVSNLNINKRYYGDALLVATHNKGNEGIQVNVELSPSNKAQVLPSLSLRGYYYPKRIQNQLNFSAHLNALPIDLLSHYLNSFASNLTGVLSGDAILQGNLDNPYF
ncbi:MAG: hypothetical protein RRY15_01400, partial [Bacteroidales bacterium]